MPRLLTAHAQFVNYIMEILSRFGRGRLVLTRLDMARLDIAPRYVSSAQPENTIRWYGDLPVET